jgi:hypothetical protein
MNGAFDDLRAALRERAHIADLLQVRGVTVAPQRARQRDRPLFAKMWTFGLQAVRQYTLSGPYQS